MNRQQIIKEILNKTNGKTYLEIGVDTGKCFLPVNAEIKIGVDPRPPTNEIQAILDGKSIRYFNMTSDSFFNNHKDIFEKHKIDAALVDGLHEYKQTLRDVENCLKLMSNKGVIVIHDCNPLSELSATRPNFLFRHKHLLKNIEYLFRPTRKKEAVEAHNCIASSKTNTTRSKWFSWLLQKTTGEFRGETWNGDVWKTIVHLRSYHDDLNIFVLDCDYGLGIVTKGRPENNLNYSAQEITKMSYRHLDKNRRELLNLKSPEYFCDFLDSFVK